MVRLEYASRYFRPRFSSTRCWDIGSIWTVEADSLGSMGLMKGASCSGEVDPAVHEAWLLVKSYFDALRVRPATVSAFASARLRASPEFADHLSLSHQVDVSHYGILATASGCLAVVEKEPAGAIRINTGAWKIDSMQPE